MKRLNKEAIEVLSNKPIWFQSGFHAKTRETIDLQEFKKRIKALKYLGEGEFIGDVKKVLRVTTLFKLKLSAGKVYEVHADCKVEALLKLISEGRLQNVISDNGRVKLSNGPYVMDYVNIYLLP
jgi:hypothetical protein